MVETSGGAVVWQLDADKSKLTSSLNAAKGEVAALGTQMDKTSGGIASAFENAKGASIAFGASIAVIGAGIIAFGVKSLQAFNEAALAIAQTEAVIASTGGAAGVTAEHIGELSAALQEASNFSDEAVRSSSNVLLTFTNIGKLNFDEAQQAVVDLSTAMGSDLQTASIQVGKALNNPIKGMGALTKVGVNFTPIQQAVITSLVETGKTAEAQKIILAELALEFGGSAAAAAKTFAGQLIEVKDDFNDFQELIGKAISERLTPLVTAFNDWFDSMGGPSGVLEHLTNNVLPPLQAALPIIIGLIIGGLTPSFVALGIAITTALGGPFGAFLVIGAAIGALVAVLVPAFGGWQNIIDTLSRAWQIFADIFTQYIQPAFDRLVSVLTTELSPSLQRLWDLISPVLLPALELLAQVTGTVLIGALRVLIEILIVVVQGIVSVIDRVVVLIGWFKDIPGLITGALSGVGEAILRPFRDAFDSVKRIFDDIKNKMAEISPFHRESPSLVDNVIRGVEIIKNQFASLESLELPQLTSASLPLSQPRTSSFSLPLEEVSPASSGVSVNISEVTIQDQQDIEAIGREIGYRVSLGS